MKLYGHYGWNAANGFLNKYCTFGSTICVFLTFHFNSDLNMLNFLSRDFYYSIIVLSLLLKMNK